MRASMRRGIAACVAIPMLILFAAPAYAEGEEQAPPSTLSERIAEAAESGATTPQEIAESVSLPVEGEGSLAFDSADRLTVSVTFAAVPDDAQLAAVTAVGAEVETVVAGFAAATVTIAPERLDALEAVPGVVSAVPALRPFTGTDRSSAVAGLPGQIAALTGSAPAVAPAAATPAGAPCGPIPIEADAPLNADDARSAFGVDGTGVTIGIISDSFNKTSVPTSWADDVASGALPGPGSPGNPGNPCGRELPVEIVSDARAGSDEGRAMAQLVHGIAPGAKLLFADSGSSELDMVNNIFKLADKGADIIVDDISFLTETYYQQSFISVAIEQVKARGITYFTSAGNSTGVGTSGASDGKPITSWQTTAYRATPCPSWVFAPTGDPEVGTPAPTADCLDFEPDTAVATPYDTLTIRDGLVNGRAELRPFGSIGEPLHGVTTSYELRFYEVRDAWTDDVEFIGRTGQFHPSFPGYFGSVIVDEDTEVRMVMVRTGYDPAAPKPAVFLSFMRGAPAIAERAFLGNADLGPAATDWVGETVFGHGGDGSGISVASLHWDEPEKVRGYSSLGPGTLLYEPVRIDAAAPSARLPQPVIVNTPHIAAVDGTQTTFFGEDEGAPGAPEYRFYGTSAAAPNAAAVAALGLSYSPELRGPALGQLVLETARGTADDGPENPYTGFSDAEVFGAGIVDANALLERIYADSPVPAQPTALATTAVTHSSATIGWQAAANANRYMVELFTGDPLPANAVQTAQLGAQQLSHAFTGLTAATRYTARVTPISALGKAGAASSITITTANSPDPKPNPAPQPNDGGPGAKGLSKTGGENNTPLIIGAVALVLLGGAAVAVAITQRRKRAAASTVNDAEENIG